jgi:hypothetical protein
MPEPTMSAAKAILWRLGTVWGIATLLFFLASGWPTRWVQNAIEADTKITDRSVDEFHGFYDVIENGIKARPAPDCLRAVRDDLPNVHCAETRKFRQVGVTSYGLVLDQSPDAQTKPCPAGMFLSSWQECLPRSGVSVGKDSAAQ